MKMFSVISTELCGRDGSISSRVIGVFPKKKGAADAMQATYFQQLKERSLEDNGASDTAGEATAGGYYTNDEAGIYDYVDFAFGQLLEVANFVISEIEVPLRNIRTEKDSHKKVSLRGQRPVLLLPVSNKKTLEPGKQVYVVDYKQALNRNGRLYTLSEKEVFKATILSVKYTDEDEFFVEVLTERAIANGGVGRHGCIQEYKLGVNVFLSEHEAKKSLAGKGV